MAPSHPPPSLKGVDSAPRPASQKGVTIFDEPEHIPEPSIKVDADDKQHTGSSPTLVASHSPKIHRASMTGKKMTGRPALNLNQSSSYTGSFPGYGAPLTHGMSHLSLDDNGEPSPRTGDGSMTPGTSGNEGKTPDLRQILSQVADWLQDERARQRKRSHQRRDRHLETPEIQPGESDTAPDNDGETSLEKLESILGGFTSDTAKLLRKGSTTSLRRSSIMKKYKSSHSAPASSDTEFFGEDILVPNVEAKLDNTKTMAFTGGTTEVDESEKAKRPDYESWITFKQDILRLTHTLKLKGWRRIPIERASEIDVARLSGALTNAVYVVHAPKEITGTENEMLSNASLAPTSLPKQRPFSLLLRIYGPQVEHLIDRDTELHILRRLARKRIGPRMLGTFENGRFEEYLHAKTLTAEDLRMAETSKQIAKRMRELHDGIDLLESELSEGPAIFVNWDKWVDRCEKVVTWLDAQIRQAEEELKAGTSRRNSVVNYRYIKRGLICGVEWSVFRKTYEAYRKRLVKDSGGVKGVRQALIFAHNDTQYGNLMRLRPSGTSPLLQPSNQHKQLVVIDFEYAAQNLAGLEFVNHFTEWCYNYHNPPDKSYICETRRYPTEEEQYRFVRSYVMHRPQFNPAASATPKMEAREKTNISDFMLDARTPGGSTGSVSGSGYVGSGGASYDYDKEEHEREKAQEEEIQRLLQEARAWRIANSAKWIAWGIVQAKIPELDALEEAQKQAADDKQAKKHERRRSVAGKISAGEKRVMEKMKHIMGKDGSHAHGKHVKPMSDPLTEEEKESRRESHWDRPESRLQEEAHAEGENTIVEDDDGPGSNDTETNGSLEKAVSTSSAHTDMEQQDGDEEEGQEESEEFDYLGYAQDRAMFFWGDCVQMGLVKEEELPEQLRKSLKYVPY